ncbi:MULTISPECIES: VWA domain-containing protein [unclassified Streptomyces]|uniref:VWA domain-containing protein n=1 Tax=unclassified Streptomyces TaxID=2593676 RepID=UPI0033E966A5
MSLFRKNTATAVAERTSIVDLTKKAAVSLTKAGLVDAKAAVYLVLDHSGSMQGFYRDGSVQRLAEQALGLSANLDDDGTVPIVYFGSRAESPVDARLDCYTGIIDRTHSQVRWGSTNYVAAMQEVIDDYQYQASGVQVPGLVIFQTDGSPDDKRAAEQMLREASSLPIFWAFVGFGDSISFLERLDDLTGRAVDNAGFFHARDPRSVSDEELYDGITREYASWLTAARNAGILR